MGCVAFGTHCKLHARNALLRKVSLRFPHLPHVLFIFARSGTLQLPVTAAPKGSTAGSMHDTVTSTGTSATPSRGVLRGV